MERIWGALTQSACSPYGRPSHDTYHCVPDPTGRCPVCSAALPTAFSELVHTRRLLTFYHDQPGKRTKRIPSLQPSPSANNPSTSTSSCR